VGDGLAVFTPAVGLPSETFVHRHATVLAPGRTLTVTTRRAPATMATWSVDAVIEVPGAAPGRTIARRAARAAARLRGRPPGAWRWRPSPHDLTALDDALDRWDVGVALTEYLDTWLPLLPWLQQRGIRVVAHSHGRDVSVRLQDPWWQAKYATYGEAEAVVAVSDHVRTRLMGLGIAGDRIHVVPCGVDVDLAPPTRPETDDVQVLAVGRMVPKKHPLATLAAFVTAAKDHPRLRLTMVGDGPLADDVARVAAASGLGDRIELLGAQPHATVKALLAGADVFVQHSVVSPVDGDEEGLPVAVLEAMAAGAPVVSTRHAGIPEAVVDGVTGLLVDEGDVQGMAQAIADLAADAGCRRELGRRGHARALERFSWSRERDDLRRLLGLAVEAPR
jgi:colanic acid/amylovoran biosynthesis glycosyltransferase